MINIWIFVSSENTALMIFYFKFVSF